MANPYGLIERRSFDCRNGAWDRYFLAKAFFCSGKSKDRSTQCGCVITTSDNDLLAEGWNGFPRRLNDAVESRHARPNKYLFTEHAERNAIYNAGRKGVPMIGAKLFVTRMPCADCARGIIQSGITEVITVAYPDEEDWAARFNIQESVEMLEECGVMVTLYSKAVVEDLERFRFT